jgi:hypothetical protein
MNQLIFVYAAYAVTMIGTVILFAVSAYGMKLAERRANHLDKGADFEA